MSRYPTPVESTDSKDYSQPDQEAGERGEEAGDRDRDSAVRGVEELELTGGGQLSRAEYVPAEYFRGVPTAQLIQSGNCCKCLSYASLSMIIFSRHLQIRHQCEAGGVG